jgi:Holliday junction resolvase RusA-like endonuclease
MIQLPIPPSVNHCWRFTSRGVFKKPAYVRWLAESALEANRQAFQGCPGPVSVAIQVIPGEGWNIMRDIDNVAKATLDFLGSGGHIDGDDCRTLQLLLVSIGMPEPKACLRVTLSPIAKPVQILTKAEARKAARASLPRAKKGQKKDMEAGTGIQVENEAPDNYFPTLDELRQIARESKQRGQAMAEHITRCCSAG